MNPDDLSTEGRRKAIRAAWTAAGEQLRARALLSDVLRVSALLTLDACDIIRTANGQGDPTDAEATVIEAAIHPTLAAIMDAAGDDLAQILWLIGSVVRVIANEVDTTNGAEDPFSEESALNGNQPTVH